MFLHVCVILFTGGGLRVGRPPLGREEPPPGRAPPRSRPPQAGRTPLGADRPGREDPPGADTSRPGSRLQHTVNERPVRILLECILGYKGKPRTLMNILFSNRSISTKNLHIYYLIYYFITGREWLIRTRLIRSST